MTSPSVGKILEHFRIYGTAIHFYKHDSQENFEYPNGIFSEHWQKTREGYCSVIEANLTRGY